MICAVCENCRNFVLTLFDLAPSAGPFCNPLSYRVEIEDAGQTSEIQKVGAPKSEPNRPEKVPERGFLISLQILKRAVNLFESRREGP